jgi:dihydrofolate reductase
MLISLIAAMDRRGLIGDETGLPWHLPMDLRRFRTLTWGKPIITGRKTFELIGKPLPGRFNIVLTRDQAFKAPGCGVARTFQEALALAKGSLASTGGDEVMIIGGGKVYGEAMERCDRLYLTIVEGSFQGSTYFPVREFLRHNWRPTCPPETHPADEKNRYLHSFHIIERAGEAAHPEPEEALEDLDLAAILARSHPGS